MFGKTDEGRRRKVSLVIILWLTILTIYSYRVEPSLSLFLIFLLLWMFLITRSWISLGCLTAVAIVYVPASTSGLFGRDTHGAVDISRKLLELDWPLTESLIFGDQTTPLMHIYAAIIHQITNLGLYPTISVIPVVPRFLPIVFVGVSLFLVSKLVKKTTSLPMNVIFLLPLILWFPLLEFYTTFRRGSMGLLLMMLLIYTNYSYYRYNQNFRSIVLFVIIALAIVLTHRATSFYTLFLLLSVYGAALINRHFYSKDHISYSSVSQLVLFGVLWIAILYMNRVALAEFATLPLITVRRLLSHSDQTVISSFTTPSSSRGLLELAPTYALFGIVGLFAITFFVHLVIGLQENGIETRDLSFFIYSGILGGFSVFTYTSPSPIEHSRILTIFIITATWIPLSNISDYRIKRKTLVRVVVAILVILTLISTSPLFIPNSNFTHQIDNTQRFEKDDYATASFLYQYSSGQTVVGDANVGEVVSPKTGNEVIGAPEAIVNVRIPNSSVVVLAERNRQAYLTTYHRQWIRIDPPNVVSRYQSNHSKIYSGGGYWVFSDG